MKIVKNSFSAWIDRMPGSKPSLIVTGKVEVPELTQTAILERAEPQGINPEIILLNVKTVPATGAPKLKQTEVRYEESPPKVNYKEATIKAGGDHLTIKVGSTS